MLMAHTMSHDITIRKHYVLITLFINHPRIPAYGMVLPTFHMGVPISANAIYAILHGHAQRFISTEILNASRVTIKTKYDTRCQGLRQSLCSGIYLGNEMDT